MSSIKLMKSIEIPSHLKKAVSDLEASLFSTSTKDPTSHLTPHKPLDSVKLH